jgi:hypothetical protein
VLIGTRLRKLVRQHGEQLGEVLRQQGASAQPQQWLNSDLPQGEQQQQAREQVSVMQGGSLEAAGGEPQQPSQPQQQQQQQQRTQLQRSALQQPVPPGALHLLVPAGGCCHLLLHEQAAAADCILGFLHACLVVRGSHASGSIGSTQNSNSSSSDKGSTAGTPSSGSSEHGILQKSLEEARRVLPGLLAALEASGWDDQKVVLEAKRRRYSW